jgi:hypothetical protein
MRKLVTATAVGVTSTAAFIAPSAAADPTTCPILASLSPGVPGVVDIDSTGDVSVLGEWVWDCPPYSD